MTKFKNMSYKGTNFENIEIIPSKMRKCVLLYCNGILMTEYPTEEAAIKFVLPLIENKKIVAPFRWNYNKKRKDALWEIVKKKRITVLTTY